MINMKNTIIIICGLLAIVFRLHSQGIEIMLDETNTKTYTEIFDSLFQNIDHRKTSTGIIYDRVFPFAGLDWFNKEKPDTSSYNHFLQAYSEISRAYTGKSELPMEVRELRRAIDRELNAEGNIVPIGLLAYSFDKIDTLSFEKGKLTKENGRILPNVSNHAELFTTREVFVASPLIKTFSGNSITFMISPDWLFSNINDKISRLEIDFYDGSGFREFNFRKEQFVKINYTKAGEKVLAFKMKFDDDEIIETKSSFNLLLETKSTIPNFPMDREVQIDASITFPDYSGNNFRGRGQATYIYANSNKQLRKPIIIVDGFDPGDKRNDFGTEKANGEPRESIWELFNAEPYKMAETLRNQGYDIVILNFHEYDNEHGVEIDGGADFIERNAFVLVELINQVNQTLTTNGSNEELVVIGPSMGGQVSRYALAYMEQNNMDHNTRLWVSFDSPHPSNNMSLGAKINYGAQTFLEFFGIAGGQEEALHTWENTVCSNAAKQMLIRHRLQIHSSPEYHAYHQTFTNNMAQIGFPENLRKIAIANGSLNGTLFHNPCQMAYEMEYKRLLTRLGYAYIYQQPGYGNSCKVFEGRTKLPGALVWITMTTTITGNDNTCSYDVAPGGTLNTYLQIKENAAKGGIDLDPNEALLESHSFISTKSAFAFQGSDQDLAEPLHTRNLVSTQETPFDSYWAPLNKNMEHVSFDEELINWLLEEIHGPCPPRFFTNQFVYSSITLNHCHTVVRDVTIGRTQVRIGNLTINSQKSYCSQWYKATYQCRKCPYI